MIANEREYRITSGEVKRFEEALAQIDDHVTELHPLLQRALREGLASELQILQEQLAEYEARRRREGRSGPRKPDLSKDVDRGASFPPREA